ncbi:MAG TPA: hypothetical protein VEV64_01230, partial [Rhizomicrobium sp.]|nr:hypothetical protein [Rhizomicrobium sp.]
MLTFQENRPQIEDTRGDITLPIARSFWRKDFVTAALLAVTGFFALGYGAIVLTGDSSPTAIMWPADAFALCLMLRYARDWRQRILMLA